MIKFASSIDRVSVDSCPLTSRLTKIIFQSDEFVEIIPKPNKKDGDVACGRGPVSCFWVNISAQEVHPRFISQTAETENQFRSGEISLRQRAGFALLELPALLCVCVCVC
jgi:hypothetical protein